MKVKWFWLLSLVLVLLPGCAPSDKSFTEEPILPSSSKGIGTMNPPLTSGTPDPAVQELVLQAQAQLAQKLGIDTDNIFLFSVEAVEWPDASLGCPQRIYYMLR